MKFPGFGLRAGILAQLIFLIIAAMLLVNVVMLNFSERDLIQSKIDNGRLMISAIEQVVMGIVQDNENLLKEIDQKNRFSKIIDRLLSVGGYDHIIVVNTHGEPLFINDKLPENTQYRKGLAMEALDARSFYVNYSGSAWGVFWLGKKDLNLSAPLFSGEKLIGGITIGSSLNQIYRKLRRSEKLALFYIILDTIILSIVGIYILSRIVVRPIHKLLKMTEGYQTGDIIPQVTDSPRNEIGNLSRSLGIMLQRLDENKKELKAHISSLEVANRELKQAQNEIIRSEKLASVGRLTAGIAHEIGNPIGIILGYLELIKKGGIIEAERRDFIDRIESEINRVKVIISQLLDFSKPSVNKIEKSHVHALLKNTVRMLEPQPMMDEIEIEFEFRTSKDEVLADSSQLQQVFLNIIINAADVLTDKTKSNFGMVKRLIISTEDLGDIIEIRFKDNGPGIPEEELIQIFDPFFTTKEPGKGTGLGLSVCYWIIEGQGGTITAESVLNEGSSIVIRLPLM